MSDSEFTYSPDEDNLRIVRRYLVRVKKLLERELKLEMERTDADTTYANQINGMAALDILKDKLPSVYYEYNIRPGYSPTTKTMTVDRYIKFINDTLNYLNTDIQTIDNFFSDKTKKHGDVMARFFPEHEKKSFEPVHPRRSDPALTNFLVRMKT